LSEGLQPVGGPPEREADSAPARPQPGPTRCAICHDGLAEDAAERWACEGCGTFAHPECAGELSRCPTLGCAGELPTGERALRYHEMLQQRDGWLLRWIPGTGAALGALLGGCVGVNQGHVQGELREIVVGVVIGAMALGLLGCVVAFALWEGWRKLSDLPEPWDR